MEECDISSYEFFKVLTHIPQIRRIFLYGSRARKDHTARSDIDIAIDCPGATVQDWNMIETIIEQADTLLTIDFIRYDELKQDNPLKKSIDRDGIILYKRDFYEQNSD